MIEGVRPQWRAKRNRSGTMRGSNLRELMASDDPAAPKLIAFESIYSMERRLCPDRTNLRLARRVRRADYIERESTRRDYGHAGQGCGKRDRRCTAS